MKKIYFLILLMTFFGCNSTVFAQIDTLIKGTEIPAFKKLDNTSNCYVYKKYVVKTTSENQDAGSKTEIFKRQSASNLKTACQTSGKSYFSTSDSDADYFIGLSNNFVFIDNGTSPDSRELKVYNLLTRQQVFKTEYSEWEKPLMLTADRFLAFESNSQKDGRLKNCSQAAKWKKEGLGVGWMQPKKLDLLKLKAVNIGGLRCIAVQ